MAFLAKQPANEPLQSGQFGGTNPGFGRGFVDVPSGSSLAVGLS